MKRKIFYCIVGALIISVLLSLLTLKITTMEKDVNLLTLLLIYFVITLIVLYAILDFITEKNLIGVLGIIDVWLESISFSILTARAKKPIIEATAIAIFGVTVLIALFICFISIKYEESEIGD